MGTRRTMLPVSYVQCSHCNKMTLRRRAHLVSGDILSGSLSEYEYLCADCHDALMRGEQDLRPGPP
jgi:hypothetical protein